MSIQDTEKNRKRLETTLENLVALIGDIRIGSASQFPFGWRKAAKGRTVWRIVEEAISQNLEAFHSKLGLAEVEASDSEVSVYDVKVKFDQSAPPIYMNVKSAVEGARTSKDDISKADGLKQFYEEDISRELFVATFAIAFQDDMSIKFTSCYVMPIAWIPDVYVNPSNNGNLQSSKYKDIDEAVKRTNKDFFQELLKEMGVARHKRIVKESGMS